MTTTVLTNENIQEAVDLWFSNEVECIRIYGRIVEWVGNSSLFSV